MSITATIRDIATDDLASRRLRLVLAANATTSLAAGLLGLLAADWCVDELGTTSSGWTRLVAAGLVLFAIDVAVVARASATDKLRAGALAISVADLGWVGLTVVALAVVDFTGLGQIAAIVQGVAVADFALLQLWLRRSVERA